MSKLFRMIRDQRGATAIEYAAIASLVSVAAIGAFVNLGERVDAKFASVDTALEQAL